MERVSLNSADYCMFQNVSIHKFLILNFDNGKSEHGWMHKTKPSPI